MRKLLLLAFVCGCGSKVEPQDQFEVGKADSFSAKMRVVGSLKYGDAALRFKYSSSPLYRAVSFSGASGDQIDVWVKSTQGDAVTWLLDGKYAVVAKNDDASASTTDSHIKVTLKKSDTFYVVMRDYDYASHYFTTQITGTSTGGCAPTLGPGGSNSSIDDYGQALEDGNAGWGLTTRKLPGCLDLGSAEVRAQVRELLRTSHLLDFDPGDTRATAVANGGNGFVQLLDTSLAYHDDRSGADAHVTSLETSIKRPVLASPDAYFEVRLSVDAEECSEQGVALVDTRTGIVYIVHQLLPC